MLARQLPVPPMNCVRVDTTGETAENNVPSRASFSASSTVRRLYEPAPWFTPPGVVEPGITTMRFVPSPWICALIIDCAPWPTATITITAPTPITIPSIVSIVRILFLRMLADATFNNVDCFMRPPRAHRQDSFHVRDRAPADHRRHDGAPRPGGRAESVHRAPRRRAWRTAPRPARALRA